MKRRLAVTTAPPLRLSLIPSLSTTFQLGEMSHIVPNLCHTHPSVPAAKLNHWGLYRLSLFLCICVTLSCVAQSVSAYKPVCVLYPPPEGPPE